MNRVEIRYWGRQMFLEKYSRFFRRFELEFAPRHKNAPYLPIHAGEDDYSVYDALKTCVTAEEAFEVQPNGDTVELLKVEYDKKQKSLKMLFHRASPGAADPTYRKKAKKTAGTSITIRKAEKQDGEEQSVSAHLILHAEPIRKGVYRAALEEIPGISMSVIHRIIGSTLREYKYEFKRKREEIETHITFKSTGIPSETLTDALKSGSLSNITLRRPAKADFVDGDGIFRPQTESMRIRVEGELLKSGNWRDHLPAMLRRAKTAGWTDFSVDLELDDKRKRTVKLDQQNEAKEVLFVRSDELKFRKELSACSVEIVDEVAKKAIHLIIHAS